MLTSTDAATAPVADDDARWQAVEVTWRDLASNEALWSRLLSVQIRESARKVLLDLRMCSRLVYRDRSDTRWDLWSEADVATHATLVQPSEGLLDFSIRIIAFRSALGNVSHACVHRSWRLPSAPRIGALRVGSAPLRGCGPCMSSDMMV